MQGEGLDLPGVCNETWAGLSPSILSNLLQPTFTDHAPEHQATASLHTKPWSEPVCFQSAVASAGKSFLNYEILAAFVSFLIVF